MLVSIGSYAICDGTLSGGVAVSVGRYDVERVTETVIPIPAGALNAVTFDRGTRKTTFQFTVQRTHASAKDAEDFVAGLDAALPSTGNVKLTLSDNSTVRYIPVGKAIRHESTLLGSLSTTIYTIIGGQMSSSP